MNFPASLAQMAAHEPQTQRYASFSAAGDNFIGNGGIQLPAGTYYAISALSWFGKLATLHECATLPSGQVQVTQGMALAIFLRLEPAFGDGMARLPLLRHVLSDVKLDSFIATMEPLVTAELNRRGEDHWANLSAAYEMLGSLQHNLVCVPADLLLTEPIVSTASAAVRTYESKFKNWSFGAMVDVASYQAAANFVQNLGNYARSADKTNSESDFGFLLKLLLAKMPLEDREHRDACAGLTRLFRRSRTPSCFGFDDVKSAPDFLASISQGIELSTDATRSDAWARNISRFIKAFRLTAILLEDAPDQHSALQRLIGAAGLEGGLNQAVMDELESTIDEHLSQSLESYSSLMPAARIAKACQDMQASIVRMKRAYSNASEGTPEQARAQAQSMTSVNKSLQYSGFQHALESAQGSNGFGVFNPDGQGLGAHQFLLHSLYNSSAPSNDAIVRLLRNLKSQYESYFSQVCQGSFRSTLSPFRLVSDDVTKLCNLDFASFDVDAFLWRFRCSVAADFKEKYPTPCKWSFIPNCMGNAFAPFERLLLAFGVDMASVNALVSMLEEIILRGGDDGPHAADNVLREYLREAQELLKAFVGGARSLTQFVGPGVNSAAGRAYTAFMESVVDKIKQQELLHIRGRSTSSSAHSKRGATPAHGGAASFLPSSSSSFSSSSMSSSSSPPKKQKTVAAASKGGKGGGKGSSRQGSFAHKVVYGGGGKYVLIGSTYYNLNACKADIVAQNSSFPVEYAYAALLKSDNKLAWCPAGANVPREALTTPFDGFVVNSYALGFDRPSDF